MIRQIELFHSVPRELVDLLELRDRRSVGPVRIADGADHLLKQARPRELGPGRARELVQERRDARGFLDVGLSRVVGSAGRKRRAEEPAPDLANGLCSVESRRRADEVLQIADLAIEAQPTAIRISPSRCYSSRPWSSR